MNIWGVEIDPKKVLSNLRNNSANIISLFRIACAPIVVTMVACAFYQFFNYGQIIWPENYSGFAFKLFIACQLSDLLDGILARLLKIESRIGAFLDRIGDKILIVPIFAFMTLFYLMLAFRFVSLLAFPITGLLIYSIYLEAMLARYGFKGYKSKAPVNSNIRGKTKMVLQCVLSAYWMLGFLCPTTTISVYALRFSVSPIATHNLIFTLILQSLVIMFTLGSIAGYKSLPEYKKLLGENNGG